MAVVAVVVWLPEIGRVPSNNCYYRCVEDHFEVFVRLYSQRLGRQYEFYRPYLQKVIYRYLDCGDLHNSFARVKCRLQAVIITSILT